METIATPANQNNIRVALAALVMAGTVMLHPVAARADETTPPIPMSVPPSELHHPLSHLISRDTVRPPESVPTESLKHPLGHIGLSNPRPSESVPATGSASTVDIVGLSVIAGVGVAAATGASLAMRSARRRH